MRSPEPRVRACPSCNSHGARPIQRYVAARLVRCDRCGLAFAGELPATAALSDHYLRYPAAGELSGLTARRYHELLDQLEQFRQTGRLLDIGCGDGHFLVIAKERGWQVYGSEYGEAPRRRSQGLGLDVRPAPFPATADERGSFDVVTAIEVLEHVADPLEETERVRALLHPGGCAYLTTPNFDSLSRRIVGPRWRAIEYPEHLNLFTPRALDVLLARVGLSRLSGCTTGISPSDLWAAVRTVDARDGSRSAPGRSADQRLREGAESSRIVEAGIRTINLALSALRMGDTIKAFYLRP